MTKRPVKVKIGPLDYAVLWVDAAWSLDTRLNGQIDYSYQIIRVAEWMPSTQQAITLLHEIVHGIHNNTNNSDDMNAEEIACMVSRGLVACWRDNPTLMDWLKEAIT